MEPAITILTGLIGAALGAWLAYVLPRKAAARQNTIRLFERFIEPEFYQVRVAAWELRRLWEEGDKDVVRFFIPGKTYPKPDEEPILPNGLSRHQNLSILLHFFASIPAYDDAGLLDRRMAGRLLSHHYSWYDSFISQFLAEYEEMRKNSGDLSPPPVWVTDLIRLKKCLRYKTENANKAVDSTATRVTPPAEQESRHGQP